MSPRTKDPGPRSWEILERTVQLAHEIATCTHARAVRTKADWCARCGATRIANALDGAGELAPDGSRWLVPMAVEGLRSQVQSISAACCGCPVQPGSFHSHELGCWLYRAQVLAAWDGGGST